MHDRIATVPSPLHGGDAAMVEGGFLWHTLETARTYCILAFCKVVAPSFSRTVLQWIEETHLTILHGRSSGPTQANQPPNDLFIRMQDFTRMSVYHCCKSKKEKLQNPQQGCGQLDYGTGHPREHESVLK